MLVIGMKKLVLICVCNST